MSKKILAGIYLVFLIILIYLFQVLIINNNNLFGAKPNLILISCIVVSMWYGLYVGSFYSLIIGIITDIVFGNSNFLFTVSYAITGVLIGFFNYNYRKENKVSLVYITIFGTAIFEIVEYIAYLMITSRYSSIFYLIKQVAVSSILNIVIVYIIYSLVIKIVNYFDDRIGNNDGVI